MTSLTADGCSRTKEGLIKLADSLVIDSSPGCSHCVGGLSYFMGHFVGENPTPCDKCNPREASSAASCLNARKGEFYCQGKIMRRLLNNLALQLERLCIRRPESENDTESCIRRMLDAINKVSVGSINQSG